jgi:hypothetical protein
MSTWSAPPLVTASALAGLRVVDKTVIPRRRARTAVASPTEEGPPRTRMDCPGRASRPVVNDPYEVSSITGRAPRVAQPGSSGTGPPGQQERRCSRRSRRRDSAHAARERGDLLPRRELPAWALGHNANRRVRPSTRRYRDGIGDHGRRVEEKNAFRLWAQIVRWRLHN